MMQKLINQPGDFVEEMLDGILAAHPGVLRRAEDPRAIVRADAPVRGKVGIATGGGSGDLLRSSWATSERTWPTAPRSATSSLRRALTRCLAVTKAVDGGNGVLYLYGNYGGDNMNFGLAARVGRSRRRPASRRCAAPDDVASAPAGEAARRRGIAGIFFLIQSRRRARARKARDLDAVAAVTEKCSRKSAQHGRRPCRRAPCPQRDGRRSNCRTAKWKSEWASMASPACAADRSKPPTRSRISSSTRFWPTCPISAATNSKSW